MLIKAGEDGVYQGTMRVKFGPTVAVFRGNPPAEPANSSRPY
jgi:hypothetical protein